MNPILVREMRARWRGVRPFLLLGGYVLLLCVFWVLIFRVQFREQSHWGRFNAAVLGRDLFTFLTMAQVGFLIGLPGLLTANTIAWEREQGLLEGMQLTFLSPARIVIGKLVSSLSFILLILLVTLPITAVNFLLGGFSGWQFVHASLLQWCTALTSAMVGLASSAWMRRSSAALRTTLGLLFCWGVGLLVVGALATSSFSGPGTSTNWHEQIALYLGQSFLTTHPMMGAWTLTASLPPGSLSGQLLCDPEAVWFWSFGAQLLSWGLLLWMAVRGTSRTLSDAPFMQADLLEAAGVVLTEPIGRRPRRCQPFINLPLGVLGRSGNPVFRRELTSKFRMRRPGIWLVAVESLLAVVVVYFYGEAIYAIWFLNDADTVAAILVSVGLFVGMVSCLVMGSTVVTRERETQSWEALRLTLLSPGQILRGKFLAILCAILIGSLPAWPLLLQAILAQDLKTGWRSNDFFSFLSNATVVLPATFCFCTMLGLWCSTVFRRSSTAISATLLLALAVYVVLPFLTLLIGNPVNFEEWILLGWHPVYALSSTNLPHQSEILWMHGGAALVGGLILALLANLRLRLEHASGFGGFS